MDAPQIDDVRRIVHGVDRIVVLTGAGISTDSGIPDFRGPDGIWTRDPEAEKYSTIDHYLADPELRERAWQHRMRNPAWTARPNAGHLALADLERRDRLDLLVTQNIDGLHQVAGNDPESVVEVHGTIRRARCVRCDWQGHMSTVMERLRAGEADPRCGECGGILKSATVFFGETLVESDVDRAFGAARACDLLICVGTTLQVYPIAQMVPLALGSGAEVVIVNHGTTPFDDRATVLRGSISEVLPALLG